jgi:succinate-semialdehyde dehydrogenase/glutarate-semialdehyde dehydrogenase
MPIQSLNPFTAKIEKTFTESTKDEVRKIIDEVYDEFILWKEIDIKERSKLMQKAAEVLRKDKDIYGKIMTSEMGKTFTQAVAEVEKCAWVCEYYAANTEVILKQEIIQTDATESYVRFDPLGVVLAVMPWNFPLWQVFRFAAPALMAGNAALLKHASNVPMCAIAIEKVFLSAGFPKNIFRTLLIGSSMVDEVINNNKVKAVTLTGSEPAGKKVAQSCGKVLKKTVMELGGSDPFIVLDDADIDEAVKTAVTARLINNGQSCIAAKRFIVTKNNYNEFEHKFVNEFMKIKTGDPMDPETQLGPIAREDLLYELDTQVKQSVNKGARILCGGERLERDGFFYKPTILANVKPGMPAYDDELFGPVASLIKAENEKDAIRIANDTCFGLGASVWTKNISKAKMFASKVESGSVFINGMVKSDPRLPFGGIKNSGYGRELSHYGIKEFVNIKTVWIK